MEHITHAATKQRYIRTLKGKESTTWLAGRKPNYKAWNDWKKESELARNQLGHCRIQGKNYYILIKFSTNRKEMLMVIKWRCLEIEPTIFSHRQYLMGGIRGSTPLSHPPNALWWWESKAGSATVMTYLRCQELRATEGNQEESWILRVRGQVSENH